MADPLHVLSTRSYWWPPFSDGLFTFGSLTSIVTAALLPVPVYLIAKSLTDLQITYQTQNRLKVWLLPLGLALVLLGAIPQTFAHYFPSAYAGLGNVPLGAAFRDVADWAPLFIVGLACLAIAARPGGWFLPAAAALACVAVLLPWISGDLRGAIRPLAINDGQIAAIEWLNARSSADTRTIWLPFGPYQKFPWSPSLVSDPTRFWSRDRLMNSLVDPAYDFFPDTTAALTNLTQILAQPIQRTHLADLLAHAGVRYIAVKTDAQSDDITHEQDLVLQQSDGIRLERQFGKVKVYEVLRPIRPDVQTSTTVALFDGSWRSMAKAAEVDLGLKDVYVSTGALGAWDLLASSSNTVLQPGTNFWDAFFAAGPLVTPGGVAGRERYPLDPGYGYAFTKGQSLTFPSKGVAAVRLLGGNSEFSLRCLSDDGGTERIVFEQPEALPRWYAIRCNGQARASLSGHVFIQGYLSISEQEFERRLDLLANALSRGGSAYVLDKASFGSKLDLIDLRATVADVTAASWRTNPLLLPAGKYEVRVKCVDRCAPGSLQLYPLGPNDWAGSLGSKYQLHADFAGSIIRVPVLGESAQSASVSVSHGIYQALIVGLNPEDLRTVAIQRLPVVSTLTEGVPALGRSWRQLIPPATMVAINESPGPWTISTESGARLRLMPADLVGSAYFAGGSSRSSIEDLTGLQLLGSLVTLIAVLALLTASRPWAVLGVALSAGRRLIGMKA
jgi:hypothetical protein